MQKKVIVTGASGFVGSAVIPKLLMHGVRLHLVGRDPSKFESLICDQVTAGGYETLADHAAGFDAILHMAARNNDQDGDLAAFREANLELLERLIEIAIDAEIGQIINMTTLHASARIKAGDHYSMTKAEAEHLLDTIAGDHLRINHLRLAAVYGKTFKGKLALINSLPTPLKSFALKLLTCIKPTVHVDRVSDAVIETLYQPTDKRRTARIISDAQQGNWVYTTFKWLMDISFALTILVLLSWLFFPIWLVVRFSSPGPGLFAQSRVGQHNKHFTLFKFRTMAKGTPQVGTHEVSEASVTRIGSFLRRTKIDELPQIINILLGQMSLVGPRPCLPVQKKLVAEREKRGVLRMKGGLTGLAQIHNIDMSTPVELAEKDAEYMALRTTFLDFKILLATAKGGGQGDKIKSQS